MMAGLFSFIKSDSRHLWWSIAVVAVPVAGQMMLQSFFGMADVLMVAELGPVAVAAVGLAAKLHFLLIVVMAGIGAGCGILVAQYSGANDFPSGQKTLALSLILGCLVMLPFTIMFAFFSEHLVSLINPDPEVVKLASRFLSITAIVILLTQIIVIYESALRALGSTGLSLIAGVSSAGINVLLNYVFIFGHFGFSAMGVEGAAWATLVSRILQLSLILLRLYWCQHGFALFKSHIIDACDLKELLGFLKFVTPLIMNHLIWAVGNTTYHVLTGYAGTDALAVMGMLVPIESIFISIFIGLSSAAAVMIGRALGSGDKHLAWQLHCLFERFTFILVLILSVMLWFSRYWVVTMFSELPPDIAALLANTLAVFAVLIWLKMFNMIRVLGVLRAGGDNHFCLFIDTLVMWGIGIPIYCVVVLSGGFSFVLIFALMYLEELAKFIPIYKRVKAGKWVNNLTQSLQT
jgi:putative MATE family efflux protein